MSFNAEIPIKLTHRIIVAHVTATMFFIFSVHFILQLQPIKDNGLQLLKTAYLLQLNYCNWCAKTTAHSREGIAWMGALLTGNFHDSFVSSPDRRSHETQLVSQVLQLWFNTGFFEVGGCPQEMFDFSNRNKRPSAQPPYGTKMESLS